LHHHHFAKPLSAEHRDVQKPERHEEDGKNHRKVFDEAHMKFTM